MTDRDATDLLIEAAASAYREREPGGRVRPSPAWCDLLTEQREDAFELQLASRELERLLDPRGWSSTVRAVLRRI